MKMMRWSPWPPIVSRKFEVVIVVRRVEGLNSARSWEEGPRNRPVVEIKWKGQKGIALRRSVTRNLTEEGGFCEEGVVEWNEEFKRVCAFAAYRDGGAFMPWEVAFTVFNGLNKGTNNPVSVIGTASLNVAEVVSSTQEGDHHTEIPLTIRGADAKSSPSLHLSLKFTTKEASSSPPRQSSVLSIPWSPSSAETELSEKAESSSLKAGLRKIKSFKDCVSTRAIKKQSHGVESSNSRSPDRNSDPGCNYGYPLDTDSLDDDPESGSEESRDDSSGAVSYEKLSYAKWARRSFHSFTDGQAEDWIYYSNRRSDVGHEFAENPVDSGNEQRSKKRMLSWRKRKLSFRSPRHKGEPLLKKDCQEDGGDDIDFDRRLLSSSEESMSEWYKSREGSSTKRLSDSEFGDDNFIVGSWETKEVISRDGLMKLKAQVFFASIDQRSERAAGESACTALVAVFADWLQFHRREMPTRSEFDGLIRDGSLEWRNLCQNEEYQARFPDKHFDLETVLKAKIRPICVVPEKSFIGFFHPEEAEEEEKEGESDFDFFNGMMSFDAIWDEIRNNEADLLTDEDRLIYIVSWNDHFFVLLVERDAYYIIDTLGERLYEGCSQAYVLKFEKDTVIERLPKDTPEASKEKSKEATPAGSPNQPEEMKEAAIVSLGKESCKEYIKSFLAALPIRQLKSDVKKGLMSGTSVHHRLQVEFHCTKIMHEPMAACLVKEAVTDSPVGSEIVAAA